MTCPAIRRWYPFLVVSEPDVLSRHWIITAYLTKKLVEGEVEWKRS